jgi:hypothetical protein
MEARERSSVCRPPPHLSRSVTLLLKGYFPSSRLAVLFTGTLVVIHFASDQSFGRPDTGLRSTQERGSFERRHSLIRGLLCVTSV